jgi:trigger factor
MSESIKTKNTYTDLKIEELPGSEIEITGEIPVDFVESFRAKTVKKVIRNIELPGFRKGHVPEDMAISHINEQELLKDIAEQALGDSYTDIVTDNKLEVVGRPVVTITKLAPKNPIGFKIRSAVFPKIELPEYKKLAEAELKKHDDPEKSTIDDAEIEKELENLQKAISFSSKSDNATEESAKVPEPIDDAFAQKLGNFKNLQELKEKMKEQLLFDKKSKAYEKRRLGIADAILVKTKMEVPSLFTEGELDQMVASFNERVSKAGIAMDEYLKQIQKTVDDLRKEWRVDAEKRAKLQLVLNEIAQKEAILPNVAKIDREVKHVLEHYPDANEHAVKTYVGTQMANEKVFELLEGGKRPNAHVHTETCDHGSETSYSEEE